MKKIYQAPLTKWVEMEPGKSVLVVVSNLSGGLSDGTGIGDGGDDDGSAFGAVKERKNLWDDVWE